MNVATSWPFLVAFRDFGFHPDVTEVAAHRKDVLVNEAARNWKATMTAWVKSWWIHALVAGLGAIAPLVLLILTYVLSDAPPAFTTALGTLVLTGGVCLAVAEAVVSERHQQALRAFAERMLAQDSAAGAGLRTNERAARIGELTTGMRAALPSIPNSWVVMAAGLILTIVGAIVGA